MFECNSAVAECDLEHGLYGVYAYHASAAQTACVGLVSCSVQVFPFRLWHDIRPRGAADCRARARCEQRRLEIFFLSPRLQARFDFPRAAAGSSAARLAMPRRHCRRQLPRFEQQRRPCSSNCRQLHGPYRYAHRQEIMLVLDYLPSTSQFSISAAPTRNLSG